MPKRNTIEVIINARDNASGVLNSLAGSSQRVGGVITAAFAGAAIAVGASVAVMVTKGLNEFRDFEEGMNEVFTLLPSISGDAMDAMADQVQDFANQTGNLSSDVIPALYQSISAGVPQENVFDFLAIAHNAALGGVTDLETAVDGITSVINAYGTDVLSAAEASDLMFTAVRLGKTTFEELSASIFRVSPTAADLGVSFDNVTAAIALMTSQGVPTRIAAGRMNAALLELGDSGTQVGEIFTDVAGQSFRDFMAGGGSLQEALGLIQQAATDTGTPINELFGSVDAGAAILALTGENAEAFADVLAEMGDATGATEAAATRMNMSIEREFERIGAVWQNLLINIGGMVAPLMRPLVAGFADFLTVIHDLIGGRFGLEGLDEALEGLPALFRPIVRVIAPFIFGLRTLANELDPNNPDGFFGALNAGVPIFAVVLTTFRKVMRSMGVGTETINTINTAIIRLKMGFDAVRRVISRILDPIIEWVRNNVKLKDVLIAVGIAVASFVIPALLGIIAAVSPIIIGFALLVGAVALVRKAWETDFGGIRTFVEGVFGAISSAIGFFRADLDEGVGIVRAFKDAVAVFFIKLEQDVSPIFGTIFRAWLTAYDNILVPLWNGIRDFVDNVVLPALDRFAAWFVEGGFQEVATSIGNFMSVTWDVLSAAFTGFWNIVSPVLKAMWEWFTTGGFQQIKDAIGTFLSASWNVLVAAFTGAWDLIKPVLDAIWSWFTSEQFQGVKDSITDFVDNAWSNLTTAIEQIWTTIEPILSSFWDWFVTSAFPAIKDAITDFITNYWNVLKDGFLLFWDLISPILSSFWDWFVTSAFPAIKDAVTDFITNYWNVLKDGFLLFWDLISPILTSFKEWFTSGGFILIKNTINSFMTETWNVLVAAFTGAWDLISPALNSLKDGLVTAFNFIKNNVIQPVIDAIATLVSSFSSARDTVSQGISLGGGGGSIRDTISSGIQAVTPFGMLRGALGFQFGGAVSAGVPVRVGEGGAETFVPRSDGEILNAQDTAAMGGNQPINISFVFQRDISDNEARESAQKLKRELQAQGISVEGAF